MLNFHLVFQQFFYGTVGVISLYMGIYLIGTPYTTLFEQENTGTVVFSLEKCLILTIYFKSLLSALIQKPHLDIINFTIEKQKYLHIYVNIDPVLE